LRPSMVLHTSQAEIGRRRTAKKAANPLADTAGVEPASFSSPSLHEKGAHPLSYASAPEGSTPHRSSVRCAKYVTSFFSNRTGVSEIYAMNANGALQTRLTRNAADDYDPAWSPGGTKMAFVSNRDGNEEIYTINPDGSSRPKRLVARFAARILPKRKERGSFGAPALSGRGPFEICATILRQASLHLW
jgi:hypothetical protein